MNEDNLIFYGDAVKVLGENRIGGYLVRYGDPDTPDLEGDFFSPETDLGIETKSTIPVYYQHGYDPVLKSRKLGKADVEFQDVGVWVEAQLEMRDEYEKRIMELAAAGKLGWSSGAAGHLVERERVGKSWRIKSWPIAEASLTPTPAEPRNNAVSVKSLFDDIQPAQETPEPEHPTKEDFNMTEEIKAPVFDQDAFFTKMQESQQAVIDEAVEKAIKALEPEKKADFQVTGDEADRALEGNPFKAVEFFKAVYHAEVYGQTDKRLLPLKATGLNEAIPSEGGFLVTPDIAAGITQNMWGIGSILSRMNPINVSGNGLTIRAINETSRADGSRMGGVRGYWLGEAEQKTTSKPTFRNIELKLKKVAALVYATDELLEDASALEGWIAQNVPMELRFQVENALINGLGVGTPLGVLQAGCLVTPARYATNAISAQDIPNMWARRYIGTNDYIWLANASVMPQIYQLAIGNIPVYQPAGGYSQAPFGTIFGRPVLETEYSPYLGAQGDLMLFSPSQYAFITKGGVQAASSIHIKFDYDETAFRFVYRCDGQPIWASAVTTYPVGGGTTTTISPFVALAATT